MIVTDQGEELKLSLAPTAQPFSLWEKEAIISGLLCALRVSAVKMDPINRRDAKSAERKPPPHNLAD